MDTKENPADEASRGLGAHELANSHRWGSGPDFLWKPFDHQTNGDEAAIVSENDPEIKKTSFKRKGHKQKSTVIKTPREQKGAAHLDHVSVEELRLAEIEIVKAI